jgi:hypothetical protein
MSTVLVVANETLASRSLVNAVRMRARRGEASFVVAAPMARSSSGLVSNQDVQRSATEHRVEHMVDELRKQGIEARGEAFDPDPFSATMDAVGHYRPDEIIISTHPETRSGWLRRDLIERVREATGLPVEHVVVDLDAEREDAVHTLVVANKTASGSPLLGLLRGKAEEKPHRFIVVVPHEDDDPDGARDRLEGLVTELRGEGLDAAGALGDPDPYTAVVNALSFYKVDEIVISTHPATRSGWLRADLIERVRRSTSVPVEHVVVDLQAGDAETASRG